jgi:hypothetical protein
MHCMRRGPSEVRLPPIMPRQRCCGCRGARKQDHAAARSVDRVEAGKVSRCRGEPAICLPCQCGRAVRCARSAPDLSSGAAPRHSRASHQPRTCTEWGGKGGLGVDARQNHPRRCARTRTNARRTCRDAEPARGSSGTSGCSIPSSFEMPERATRA